MSARKAAPFGSWASPITVDLLLKGTVQLRNQMVRWDGDDLYWSELRPDEAGRIVVCRRTSDGATSDVTPKGFNARTRVHEYGGGHFAVTGGTVWFANFADQRLYRQEGGGLPLGIFPDAEPAVQRFTLDPGDVLFLFTDGLTSACGPDMGYFEDRLIHAAKAIADRLHRGVDIGWRKDAHFRDFCLYIGQFLQENVLIVLGYK